MALKASVFIRVALLVCLVALQACAPVVRVGPGTHLAMGGTVSTDRALERARQELHPTASLEEFEAMLSAKQIKLPQGHLGNIEKALQEDLAKLSAECRGSFSALKGGETPLSTVVSLIGGVAGAVAVPLLVVDDPKANEEGIAALGGLSGFAHGAHHILGHKGISSKEAFKVLGEIRQKWDKALEEHFTAPRHDIPRRKRALGKAAAACLNHAVSNPGVKVDTTKVEKQ